MRRCARSVVFTTGLMLVAMVATSCRKDSRPPQLDWYGLHDVPDRYLIAYDHWREDDEFWPRMPFDRISLERTYFPADEFPEDEPTYRVDLYRGGRATRRTGEPEDVREFVEGRVSAASYARLCYFLERIPFEQLREGYQAQDLHYILDVVQVEVDGRIREVADQDSHAPPEFQGFCALFDRIADQYVRWGG